MRKVSVGGRKVSVEAPPLWQSLNATVGRSTVLLVINLIILVVLISLLYMLASLYIDQAALFENQKAARDET